MKYKFYEPVMGTDIKISVGRKDSGYTDQDYLESHSGSLFEIKKQDGDKVYKEYELYIEDEQDFYTLSHEIIHLVKHLFRDREIPMSYDNDEIFAYYHTFLLKKLWRKIHYAKKGKKDNV